MAKRSPSWTDILAIAQAAESAGFDSFWLPDHLLFTPEGEAGQGFWECWSLLAAVAASTSRIQIGLLEFGNTRGVGDFVAGPREDLGQTVGLWPPTAYMDRLRLRLLPGDVLTEAEHRTSNSCVRLLQRLNANGSVDGALPSCDVGDGDVET